VSHDRRRVLVTAPNRKTAMSEGLRIAADWYTLLEVLDVVTATRHHGDIRWPPPPRWLVTVAVRTRPQPAPTTSLVFAELAAWVELAAAMYAPARAALEEA
jgi:hypothetical protein